MALVCIFYGCQVVFAGLGWGVGKRVAGDSFVGVEDVKDPYAGQLFFKVRGGMSDLSGGFTEKWGRFLLGPRILLEILRLSNSRL
jgi:hypothetical protein